MYQIIIFVFLLSISGLALADNQFYEPSSLSTTAGMPSSIVGGHVNTATGESVHHHTDLIIPGPEPLVFHRSYASGDHSSSYLYDCWHCNHSVGGCTSTYPLGRTSKGYKAHIPDRTGSVLTYNFSIGNALISTGMTNCYVGEISARTNLKNNTISPIGSGDDYKVAVKSGLNGSRGESLYKVSYDTLTTNMDFTLEREKTFFGNQLLYQYSTEGKYDDLGEFQRGSLTSIKACNATGDVCFSDLTSSIQSFANDRSHDVTGTITASNGQKVTYTFKDHDKQTKEKYEKFKLLLSEVSSDFFTHEKYEYLKNGSGLSKIIKPDGRVVEFEYYGLEKCVVAGQEIKSGWIQGGRVKTIKVPSPDDDSIMIPFYQFIYKPKGSGEFTTEVYDGDLHKSLYYYNEYHHLSKIENYTKEGSKYKLSHVEKYLWGKFEDHDRANLRAIYLKDKDGYVPYFREYQYDPCGNVEREMFYGNVSGLNTPKIILGKNGYPDPKQKGVECYLKDYKYTNDNYKLLASEEEANGKKIEYSYLPNTDRISSQIVSDKKGVRKRLFFEYDSYGTLIKKTIDDSPNRHDLNGATMQLITLITPEMTKSLMGLPKIEADYYLDFQTNEQKLISKNENHYSQYGKLIQKDHYDSNGEFRFSLKWDYDLHGNLISEENALGEKITRRYDLNDNLEYEEKEGLKTTYEYDKANRLKSKKIVVNGKELTTHYSYDNRGNKIEETDCYGNITEYKYDDFSRLVEVKSPQFANENGQLVQAIVKTEYDLLGNPNIVTDANDNKTMTDYNVHGKPVKISYPDKTFETFEYEPDGSLKISTAKNGMVIHYKHDIFGRLLSKKMVAGTGEDLGEETFVYSGFNLLSSKDAKGFETIYIYDGAGRQKSVQKENALTEFEYDALGRKVKTIEQYGSSQNEQKVIVNDYDLLNRILEERVEDYSGIVLSKVKYTYDFAGNKKTETRETQRGEAATTYDYDELKQPKRVEDALGNFVRYEYNYQYENEYHQKVLQTTVEDLKGNKTITTMDALKRPVREMKTNISGNILSDRKIYYDGVGNVTRIVDNPNDPEEKRITRWRFNKVNEIEQIIEAFGTDLEKASAFTYSKGQKDALYKPNNVTIFYEYDGKGRLKRSWCSGSFDYLYDYDFNDNLSWVKDQINSRITVLEYDSLNRLKKETLANLVEVKYDYDNIGRIRSFYLPDNSRVDYEYDALFLRKVSRIKDNEILYSHQYQDYDLSGNLLSAQLIGKAEQLSYSYDLLSRPLLIQHTHWKEAIPDDGYDCIGNLTQLTIEDGFGKVDCNFKYNDLYQLIDESGITTHQYEWDSLYNRVGCDGEEHKVNLLNQLEKETDYQYEYLDGNLVSRKFDNGTEQKEVGYSYDALDRLETVKIGDDQYRYYYDAFNRRLSKSHYQRSGIEWVKVDEQHFIYQGQNEIGSCDAKGNIIELRVLGVGKGAEIGASVAIEIREEVFAPIHDHNGNIVCLVDSLKGTPVNYYRYTAFGEELVSEENSVDNPWRFSSKRVDPETQFVYFGRRYYEPRSGRWITQDPLGLSAGPNLYAYLLGNPLTHFDLYGLFDDDIADDDYLFPNYASNWLKENSFKEISYCNFESFFPYGDKSQNFDLGLPDIPDFGVGFTNGLVNSIEDARENAMHLSKLGGGVNVHATHNASQGYGFGDLIESFLGYYNIATEPVKLLHEKWDKFFDNSSPRGLWLEWGHSQGAMHVRNALIDYPEERRDRIFVAAIAPAAYLSKELCKDVRHYRASLYRDFVPGIDYQGAFQSRNSIIRLESHPNAPFMDHPLSSETYKGPIKFTMYNFLNKGSVNEL